MSTFDSADAIRANFGLPVTSSAPPFLPSGTVRLFKDATFNSEFYDIVIKDDDFRAAKSIVDSPMQDQATWCAYNLPVGVVVTLTDDIFTDIYNVPSRHADLVGTGSTESVDFTLINCDKCISAYFWRRVNHALGGFTAFELTDFGGNRRMFFLSDYVEGNNYNLGYQNDWWNDRVNSIKWGALGITRLVTFFEHIDGGGSKFELVCGWTSPVSQIADLNANGQNFGGKISSFSWTSASDNLLDCVRTAVTARGYFSNLCDSPAYLRLMDTPHVWGQAFSADIMANARRRQAEFERAIVEMVQHTKYRCDLSSLNTPDPDWVRAILGAIDTCLTTTMHRTQPTQFRFLFGQTPTHPVGEPPHYTNLKASLVRLCRERSQYWEVMPEFWMGRFYRLAAGLVDPDMLTDELIPTNDMQAFGVAVVGGGSTKMTWNHSKIISVDGVEALVGGHNLNMDLFRSYPPVHDVSVVVHGEAARDAQLYLDKMWACGEDLFVKESMKHTESWWWSSTHLNPLSDPLADGDGAQYMSDRQAALLAMHKSGKQSGQDEAQPNGEDPMPKDIAAQDLQTLTDLNLTVFQERITYNTYEGFSDYRLANRILTLGKYWDGPNMDTDFKKASEIMKELLIKGAKRTIRMSQMDLVSAWKKNWSDHVVCQWVMEALLANPNLVVQIVVSPLDAAAGAAGDQYSFGSGASRTFELMQYYMSHVVETDGEIVDYDGSRANALSRLYVAPFYFTDKVPDGSTAEGSTYFWPNVPVYGRTASLKQKPLSEKPPDKGKIGSAAMALVHASGFERAKVPPAPGNHAKIMIVDDEHYVIGSDNLYPGFLSEVDYIVEGKEAVDELINSYWKPLWQYSGPHSISGGKQ